MSLLIVRPAAPFDLPHLRAAMVELQEHERLLHATRLPGEAVADAYLAWMLDRAAEASGAAVIAEADGAFAGFAAGWVVEDDVEHRRNARTRTGTASFRTSACLPAYRGRRVASRLIEALEVASQPAPASRASASARSRRTAPRGRSYERSGYAPYEVVYEKVVATDGGQR